MNILTTEVLQAHQLSTQGKGQIRIIRRLWGEDLLSFVRSVHQQIQEPCELHTFVMPGIDQQRPFYPLGQLIQRSLGSPATKQIRSFLDGTVLPDHVEDWLNLTNERSLQAREDLFPFRSDMSWERRSYLNEALAIIRAVSRERIVWIAIDDLRKTSYSLLTALAGFAETVNCRVLILAGLPDNNHENGHAASVLQAGMAELPSLIETNPLRHMVDLCDERGWCLVGSDEEREQKAATAETKAEKGRRSSKNSLEDRIRSARQQLLVYSWQDALRCIESGNAHIGSVPNLTKQISDEPVWLRSDYHSTRGDIDFLAGQLENAGLWYEQAIQEASRSNDPQRLARARMRLALVFHEKKSRHQALSILERARSDLAGHEDPAVHTELAMLNAYLCDHESWRNDTYHVFFELFARLDAGNYAYWRIILSSYLPWINALIHEDSTQTARRELDAILKLVKKKGNLYRESVILHLNGVIADYEGDKATALSYLQQSIDLRRRLGDSVELVKIHNGTGYFCFSIGDFDRALDNYTHALKELETGRDYTEICLTLYNIALVSFFTLRYADALSQWEDIITIMDEIGLQQIPWHSRSYIYAMCGVCAHHLGRRSRSREYLRESEQADHDPEAEQVQTYLGVLTSSRNDADKADALEGMAWAIEAEHPASSQLVFHVRYDAALHRKRSGAESEALSMLKAELNRARELKVTYRIRMLERELALWSGKEPDSNPASFEALPFQVSKILQLARQEALERRLKRREDEIDLLDSLGESLRSAETAEQLVASTMNRLLDLFPISRALLVYNDKGQVRGLFSWPEGLNPTDFASDSTLRSPGEAIVIGQDSNGIHQDLSSVIRLPLGNPDSPTGVLWLGCRPHEGRFDQNDLRIVRLAMDAFSTSYQLFALGDRSNQERDLDMLTQLAKKREAERVLRLELSRMSSQRQRGLCLLVVDLDHFEVVNDSVGYPAGDLVLRNFSTILNLVARDFDHVSRLEGDSFVMVLPECDLGGAEATARRILTELLSRRNYEAELKRFLGQAPAFPPGFTLSCSIGVTVLEEANAGPAKELINAAFERVLLAMRQAKLSGRKQIVSLLPQQRKLDSIQP